MKPQIDTCNSDTAPALVTRTDSPEWCVTDIVWFATMLGIALLMRVTFFTGLTGSDDTVYAIRGMEAAQGLWLPSDYVGDLRYGVNLPIALFVKILGPTTAGLHAWAMLCSLGEIAVVFLTARHLWGLRTASLAALVMAVTPLHVHAGGRALADAPLALFITISFAAFLFAERSRRAPLYWLAGAAIGFTWWIKPHAILFVGVFGLYSIFARAWRREWAYVFLGATAVIALEFAMFGAMFGDPFYALKAMTHGIEKNFVQQTAPWGDHAPFYYFRQMFKDGRDMGLAPVLALAGAASVLWDQNSRSLRSAGFVVLWWAGLLAFFSFTPYSISPFRLIPKQDNYALMFFGPLAILAGRGFMLMRPPWFRWLAIVVVCTTSVMLASMPQLQAKLKRSGLEQCLAHVRSNGVSSAYVPAQAITLARASELMHGRLDSRNIVRLKSLNEILEPSKQISTVSALEAICMNATWPEIVQARSIDAARERIGCTTRVAALPIPPEGIGRYVVETIAALSEQLPEPVSRQLRFVQPLLRPAPVIILERAENCSI